MTASENNISDINYNDNIQNTSSTTSEQDEINILTRSHIIMFEKNKGSIWLCCLDRHWQIPRVFT